MRNIFTALKFLFLVRRKAMLVLVIVIIIIIILFRIPSLGKEKAKL